MDDQLPYRAEYAKSGRAKCKSCKNPIRKGELRCAAMVQSPVHDGKQPNWYHYGCFFKKQRPTCISQIAYFSILKYDDQKKLKSRIDPKEEEEDLAIEAEIKKQNDEFYKFKTALQELSKKDVIALITQNNQKPPKSTSTVTAVDIAADLLTFGTPGKCTICKNGFYCLADSTYNCNGLLDEWAKCTSKTQDPQRTNTTIPKHLIEKYSFLSDYKGQIAKRVFRNVVVIKKVVIEREKLKLHNMLFLFVGKTESDMNKLKRIIFEFGGQVKLKLDSHITAVVSNQTEMDKINQAMEHVKTLQLPVLTEEFFNQLNKDSNIVQLMEKFNIAEWADVTQTLKSACIKSTNTSKMTMQIKGDGVVDPDSELVASAHVFEKNGTIYNVTLSRADLQMQKNSFYKLQILQSDINNKQFWLFRSWGRIGTTIGGNKKEIFNIEDDVIRQFEKLYQKKTNNPFFTLDFKKCSGFYNPIDIEYMESNLDEPIQNLIKLIFDINQMKQTMIQFEIDIEKMPLGKLSKSQIKKAMMELNELSGLIKRGAKESEFISPTNRFYTLIPHNFGMLPPPLLNSNEILEQKWEMLDSLMKIELAYSIVNKQTIYDNVNPIDAYYKQLNTDIEVLDSESDEYKTLQLYVINTHDKTHYNYELEIQNIYKVTRAGEAERFEKYRKLPNRKLLWHGSRITKFVSILKNGLKIAPSEDSLCTEYKFGKGIYFADMVSNSANYCCAELSNNNGLLLLCDVALGNMKDYLTPQWEKKLPEGKNSIKGVGQIEPNPMESLKQGDMEIPCGQPLKNKLPLVMFYNEYIIYDIEQVNIKYLINLKFNLNKN